MSRKTTAVALALLLALGLAGCGSDRDALTIYSGRTQNLIGPLLEQFNVGISGRQRVLVYNAEQVTEAELPGSVLDLTGDRGLLAGPAWCCSPP
jgi:hypothetical protein